MDTTQKMVEALETFITTKVNSFNESTSPDEIYAVSKLVESVNKCPRLATLVEPIEIREPKYVEAMKLDETLSELVHELKSANSDTISLIEQKINTISELINAISRM